MKGQNFIGKVIKVAAVVVEKKEGGIDVEGRGEHCCRS